MNKIFHSRIILITLTFFILLITLYFGLRFKGFRPVNHVTRLKTGSGIRFERFGIVYSQLDSVKEITLLKKFTIEIALKPAVSRTYGFNLIMTIHDGKDADQLIIGQWQSHVIIMNGDDYSHKGKTKRISADIFKKPYEKMMLTITTGDDGTELYINGELIESAPELTLMIPCGKKAMLTLGNSVYGNNSWNGNMYGFALYGHQLSYEKIKSHFNIWEATNKYASINEKSPVLFIDFDGSTIKNTSHTVKDESLLNIPSYFTVLEKRILEAPWVGISLDKGSIKDITVNLFGFIPMGFILHALFLNLFSAPQKRIMLFSVLICFLISLFIEITQAWIPSRSSQSLDLMLNTIGGMIGALGAKVQRQKQLDR